MAVLNQSKEEWRVDYQTGLLPDFVTTETLKTANEMASALRGLKHIKFVNDPVRVR